jgi:hypothetical protein
MSTVQSIHNNDNENTVEPTLIAVDEFVSFGLADFQVVTLAEVVSFLRQHRRKRLAMTTVSQIAMLAEVKE